MDITDDATDTDFATAFDEATESTTSTAAPEGENLDAGTTDPAPAKAEGAEGDAPSGVPEGDNADDAGTGDTTDAPTGEAPKDEPSATPPAADPIAQQPAPQQPVDPRYIAAAIAEYQKTQAAPPAQEQAPEPPKDYTPEDFLDDSQKAALAVFDSEWSEVKAPVTALIQAHVKAALANQERTLMSQMHQSLAPIQQVTAQSQEAMHYATIQAAHPDFREKAPEVKAWIDEQPALYKPALEQAYQQGSAAEVVQLYDAFKQAKGVTSAAPAQPASSAAQVPPQKTVPKASLNATMAPPTAQRSTPVNSKDPNDFDGAFEEAVSGR